MSIKSNVVDAVIYMACSVPLVILIVLMLWFLADHAKVYQPVANEVANGVANGVVAKNTTTDEIVVNNTANRVTTIETEVYRVVCVEPADTFCKEFSVRRINRE